MPCDGLCRLSNPLANHQHVRRQNVGEISVLFAHIIIFSCRGRHPEYFIYLLGSCKSYIMRDGASWIIYVLINIAY